MKYKKLFAGFFIIMLMLTVLSRVIDSIMIPKVQIKTATSGNLSYVVLGEGVVKALDMSFLEVPEGVKIDRVVPSGQTVEAGQSILFLRVSQLEEKKKERERSITKMRLSLEREKTSGKPAARITEQEQIAGELAQAQKDLFDFQVTFQAEQEEYTRAMEELTKKRARDRTLEARRFSLSKEEIDKLKQVSGNQVEQNYSQTELTYSAASSAIEDSFESDSEQLADQLKAAAEAVNEKQDAFHQVQYRAELAVKSDAYTSQNEQSLTQISRKTQEILKVDLDAEEEKIKKIEDLIQADGEVKTGNAGMITKMEAAAGSATTGNEIIEIGSGKFLFQGELKKEDTGLLEEGDGVAVSMPMQTKPVKGIVTNIAIKAPSDSEVYAEFTAELEEGNYRIGSAAEYKIEKNSQLKYSCLIPIEAVREDGNGKFCLIAEKRTTILGEEEIAVRVNIELIKKDAAYAAVQAVFGSDERIITGSSKAIEEGDRVRIQP